MPSVETFLGKNISRICESGVTDNDKSHCAHFVSHVMGYAFGYTCHKQVYRTKRKGAAASLRVNDVFNNCPKVGLWTDKPSGIVHCLVFVTRKGNVTLNKEVGRGTMGSHKQKHIGIYKHGQVYHYNNTQDKVVSQSVDSFTQAYIRKYGGAQKVTAYYGTLPFAVPTKTAAPTNHTANAASFKGSLTSPRFTTNSTLEKVAKGGMELKRRDTGNAVHIVQQAIIDLGYTLTKADGIFGRKTKRVVKKFQEDKGLEENGCIDKNTLLKIDSLLPGFQHRIKLNFRSIDLTHVHFETILSSTKLVYAQYGIRIEMGPSQSLFLTPEQRTLFAQIDSACTWHINSGEIHQLQGLGHPVPSNEVLVFYVSHFQKVGLLGCGGHARDRPAVTVAANASKWDTAHEVGHVLLTSAFGEVHNPDVKNLMHATASSYLETPILTTSQLAQMRKHICCVKI